MAAYYKVKALYVQWMKNGKSTYAKRTYLCRVITKNDETRYIDCSAFGQSYGCQAATDQEAIDMFLSEHDEKLLGIIKIMEDKHV